MNILIDILPTSVEIDNEQYEINSDFRTAIIFEMLMQDDEVNEYDKILTALELFYPVIPTNLQEAIDKIMWFYAGDTIQSKGLGKGVTKSEQQYNYEYDADYIFAAFLDQYGIDLNEIEYMHWWKFKALFKNLKEDNLIVKIMQYRSIDLRKIKDKEEQKRYKGLKELYKIPISKTEVEKKNEIDECLKNGGDINEILKKINK